jgi:peptidoglycan/xylan/chitin deacetylase (PgdA/CDA1 family)
MKKRFSRRHVILVALTAALAGCDESPARKSGDAAGDSTGAIVRDSASGSVTRAAPRDTSYGPRDTMGRIPVLEYHVIGDKESQFTITPEHFRKDLELVYSSGYRPITIAQMLDKDFSAVPDGLSPVVFVFDDASDSQFRYIEKNGALEIDPTSAIGIWEDFARKHSDWKGKAVFCLLNGGEAGHNFFGDKEQFGGQKNEWRHRKVKYLADQGHELCAHTLWHMQLSKFPDAQVQENIARNVMGIDSAVAGYRVRTMALPQGLWPKNRPLAWQGSWTDPKTGKVVPYHFDAVLEVSGGPARSPYDPQFNPHSINRIQGFGNQIPTELDRMDRTKTRFVK